MGSIATKSELRAGNLLRALNTPDWRINPETDPGLKPYHSIIPRHVQVQLDNLCQPTHNFFLVVFFQRKNITGAEEQ